MRRKPGDDAPMTASVVGAAIVDLDEPEQPGRDYLRDAVAIVITLCMAVGSVVTAAMGTGVGTTPPAAMGFTPSDPSVLVTWVFDRSGRRVVLVLPERRTPSNPAPPIGDVR